MWHRVVVDLLQRAHRSARTSQSSRSTPEIQTMPERRGGGGVGGGGDDGDDDDDGAPEGFVFPGGGMPGGLQLPPLPPGMDPAMMAEFIRGMFLNGGPDQGREVLMQLMMLGVRGGGIGVTALLTSEQVDRSEKHGELCVRSPPIGKVTKQWITDSCVLRRTVPCAVL